MSMCSCSGMRGNCACSPKDPEDWGTISVAYVKPDETSAIVAAAKEWAVERHPNDAAERYLMAMVAKAFPEEWVYRDDCVHCSEDDREGCDECPSREELASAIRRAEAEHAENRRTLEAYVKELTQE